MVCKVCGTTNKEGIYWCEKCGFPLISEDLQKNVQQANVQNMAGVQQANVQNTASVQQANVQNSASVQQAVNLNNEVVNQVNTTNQNNLSANKIDNSIIRKAIKKEAKSKQKTTIIAAVISMFAVSILSSIAFVVFIYFVLSIRIPFGISAISSPFVSNPVVSSSFAFFIIIFLLIVVIYALCYLMSQVILRIALEVSRGNYVTLGSAIKYVFSHKWECLSVAGIQVVFGILEMAILRFSSTLGPLVSIVLALAIVMYFFPVIFLCNYAAVDDLNQDKLKYGIFSRCLDLMRSHRIEFYGLLFSFIGWNILVVLSFGLLSLWVIPYITLSFANFYRYLSGESNYRDASPGLGNEIIVFGAVLILVLMVLINIIV